MSSKSPVVDFSKHGERKAQKQRANALREIVFGFFAEKR